MSSSTDPDHTPEGASLTELILEVFKLNGRLLGAGDQLVASLGPVSYTHLTLPTNREV